MLNEDTCPCPFCKARRHLIEAWRAHLERCAKLQWCCRCEEHVALDGMAHCEPCLDGYAEAYGKWLESPEGLAMRRAMREDV